MSNTKLYLSSTLEAIWNCEWKSELTYIPYLLALTKNGTAK
ncbi:hypothetical protein NT04LM_3630 [Listeria monocytogenes FSL F2-208]|nr:hypothetical protein NT04LM_3630 [Listeria monocytogenes FSL F2-208]